jgi:hypothetical protein
MSDKKKNTPKKKKKKKKKKRENVKDYKYSFQNKNKPDFPQKVWWQVHRHHDPW